MGVISEVPSKKASSVRLEGSVISEVSARSEKIGNSLGILLQFGLYQIVLALFVSS